MSKYKPLKGIRAACRPHGRYPSKRKGDATFRDAPRPRNSEVRYSTLGKEELERIFTTA